MREKEREADRKNKWPRRKEKERLEKKIPEQSVTGLGLAHVEGCCTPHWLETTRSDERSWDSNMEAD